MAKSKATTQKTACVTAKINSEKTARTGKMSIKETGGVVAYTKGSRFKDAEVLKVVQRVLSQS